MIEKIQGMQISEEQLKKNGGQKGQLYASSFNISWLGGPGSTNGAVVETTFESNKLGAQVVVTGTPTWGTACKIAYTPINCKLASGDSNVEVYIEGANLGTTFLSNITPESSYKGQVVKFQVSITAAADSVLYANGAIGQR